jgi:hypothetical protein
MSSILNPAIAAIRLENQRLARPDGSSVTAIVSALGAVQAQEFEPAKWALGLRIGEKATDPAVERAFASGQILRTHVLRPTWHFVPRADIRWMLALTAPHVHRAMASYRRKLGLQAAVLTRSLRLLERILGEKGPLTRAQLRLGLAEAGLALDPERMSHVMMNAELEALVCSGPRQDRQFTYALLSSRAPQARLLPRDEALGRLTRRYFSSHGPATVRDFVWWSGLSTADAKRGLEMIRARSTVAGDRHYWSIAASSRRPIHHGAAPAAHLLPIYDEYLVAYRDRDAVPHAPSIVGAGGHSVTFRHALVVDGRVTGTWNTSRKGDGLIVTITPLRRLTREDDRAIALAVSRYERFVGLPVSTRVLGVHRTRPA